MRTRGLVVSMLAVGALLIGAGAAGALQSDPNSAATSNSPTETNSPHAPDPSPPAGGVAPDGSTPGGNQLRTRSTAVAANTGPLPDLNAASWIVVDYSTNSVLAARDPHGRYQPASLLKLLTAITVAPQLDGTHEVTITPDASGGRTEGSAIGLLSGAQYTVDELFEAMLLVSANDASTALADANGGVEATVAQMNAVAAKLGAYDTVAQTTSGLDGWQQLTSVYDLALVVGDLLKQPRLLAYEQQPQVRFPARTSDAGRVGAYGFTSQTSGFFDAVPGAIVAKAGFTDAALRTYAAVASRSGRQVGVIMLRSSASAAATEKQAAALVEWGFANASGAVAVGPLSGPVASSLTTPPVDQNSNGHKTQGPLPYIKLSQPTSAPGGRLAPVIVLLGGSLWLIAALFLTRLSRRRRHQLRH